MCLHLQNTVKKQKKIDILKVYKMNLEKSRNVEPIECEWWRRHSSLIFLILLFTKPNIEVSGWMSPPSFTLDGWTSRPLFPWKKLSEKSAGTLHCAPRTNRVKCMFLNNAIPSKSLKFTVLLKGGSIWKNPPGYDTYFWKQFFAVKKKKKLKRFS